MSVTMKKSAAVLRGPVPKGKPGRLPVAPVKAKSRLAGRGGEKLVSVVSDFGDELEDLDDLARQLVEVNKQIANLKIEAATLRGAINPMMAAVNPDESWTVRSEDTAWIATYIVPKETQKLEPRLLLLAGVTDKQLKKGYRVVPAKKPYVQVRTKGEEVGENEEHE